MLGIQYLVAARISEVIALTRSDFKINLKRNEILIYRTALKRKDKLYAAVYVNPKDSLVPKILSYLEQIHKEYKIVNDTDSDEYYIFPQRNHVFGYEVSVNFKRHISRRQALNLSRQYLDCHDHYLRHLRITHLASHMNNIMQLKAISLHKKFEDLEPYLHLMTKDYAHLIPAE
jgi:integrase